MPHLGKAALAALVGLTVGQTGAGSCFDDCYHRDDGDCDDGGPGAEFNVCGFSHDCTDCGPRTGAAVVPSRGCGNSCSKASDGDCDDGGDGAEFGICTFGSDCTDCGPRAVDIETQPGCYDTCWLADNGECDDGGDGSEYENCAWGTDCFDCGLRPVSQGPAPPPPQPPGSPGCNNECVHASDTDCDDGGAGDEYGLCALGSDCLDCGDRGILPPSPPPVPITPGCNENCIHASDGDCDDGGPGAEYGICGIGMDCFDCGDRGTLPPNPPPIPVTPGCNNECTHASDGDCDDGGPGDEYGLCTIGSDCIDCGDRGTLPPFPPPGAGCGENCNYSSDGDCDDNGPGSEYAICPYGQDCVDCGPRAALPPSPPPFTGPPIGPGCSNTCNFVSDAD